MPAAGPVAAATAPYFEFVVDSSNYGGLAMSFDADAETSGDWASGNNNYIYVYHDAGSGFDAGTGALLEKGKWTAYSNSSPIYGAGTTTFRINAYGAQKTGALLAIDNVAITGCARASNPPVLAKSFATSPLILGSASTLTFSITNPNATSLTGVGFSDVLPAGLTISTPSGVSTTCTTGSLSGGTISALAGSSTISLAGATLSANAACTLAVSVTGSAAGQYRNVSSNITATETGPTTTSSGYGTADLTIIAPPVIAKRFGASSIFTDGTTSLILSISNPNMATTLSGLSFTDALPAGLVVASPNGLSNTCGGTATAAAGSSTVSLSGASLAANTSCTVSVIVKGTTAGTKNNSVTVTSSNAGAGNTAAAPLSVRDAVPRIAVLKQVGSSSSGPWSSFMPATAAGAVYYRFTVENTGDVDFDSFSITDPNVSTAGCAWQTTNSPSTLPRLPVAAAGVDPSAYCVVAATATSMPGQYPNTAYATGVSGSTPTVSPVSTATYVVPQVAIVKSVSPAYYTAAGDLLHYSYTVQNSGFAPLVAPVTVTNDKIAGVIACPSPATATLIGGGAGDGDAYLDPGEQIVCPASGTVAYTVTTGDLGSKSVTNSARAAATDTLGHGVYSPYASKTAYLAPDLAVTKSNDAPTSGVVMGNSFDWTLTVTNVPAAGSATFASGQALLADDLPSTGATYFVLAPTLSGVSGSIDCAISAATRTCTAAGTVTMPAGASFAVPVRVTPTSSAGDSLVNPRASGACRVDPGGVLPELTETNNDCATNTVSVVRVADLLLTKTDNQPAAEPEELLAYVLTVVNNGTLTAAGVTLDDTLPDYLAYVSDTSGVTPVPPSLPDRPYYRWSLGDLAPGASKTFTLYARVADSLPDGTTSLQNYAVVHTSSLEKDQTNNEVADIDSVTTHPDLSIAKGFTSNPPATTGSTIDYRLSGGNIGHAAATGVTIVDTLDELTTYVAGSAQLTRNGSPATLAVSYNDSTKTLTFGLPDLTAGDTYVLTYSATVGTVPTPPRSLLNTATIDGAQADLDASNDTASVAVPAAHEPDLVIVKTAAGSSQSIVPGDTIAYTLAYRNDGADEAPDTVIQDTLPSNTTLVPGSITGGGSFDSESGVITWELGALASKAAGSVGFSVQVVSPLPTGVSAIDNAANISADAPDATPANNTSTTSTPVTAQPDLVISKTDGRTQVLAGDMLHYTITYRNAGNQAASGVTVVDTLLDWLEIDSTKLVGSTYNGSVPPSTYNAAARTLTWVIGALPVDGEHTITLDLKVKAAAPPLSVAADRVQIADDGANGADPNPSDDTSTDSDTTARPYVVLEKRAAGPTYTGQRLNYEITWRNASDDAPADDLVVQDTLPENTTLIAGSITPDGAWTYNAGTRTITWSLGTQPPGSSGTLGFAVIPGPAAGGGAQTSPTLSSESASGSVVVTSQTSAVTRPWCDFVGCTAYKGIYQGTNGTPPAGWNDNPRMTVFDDGAWIQPVAPTPEPYWTDPAPFSAQWTTVHTEAETYGHFSFFRQAFCLPLNAAGYSGTLQIAGDDVADIYLNGIYLGRKYGSGQAAAFDATTGVQSGENVLAVQLLTNRHGGHTMYDAGDHSGIMFNLAAGYAGERPFVSAPAAAIAGQVVTFAADEQGIGGQRPYEYAISYDGGTLSAYQSSPSFTHDFTTPGLHTATISARTASGCTGSDTVKVEVLAADSNLLAKAAGATYRDANGRTFSAQTGTGVELLHAADLSVGKQLTGGGTQPGQAVGYRIVVTNNGPDAVAGATLTDVMPAAIGNVTWTCSASPGSSCTVSGTGSIGDAGLDLLAGGTATYVVGGIVDPSAPAGALVNTAGVSAPSRVLDLAPGNNSSTVSSTVSPVVDLSVTKTSSPNPAVPGQLLTYVITVSNAGPNDASGASVADTFPAALSGITWTCRASSGSSCTAAGAESIHDSVNLKSGGTVTYTAIGLLDAAAVDRLDNTATVSTGAGTIDSDPSDNSATDANTPAEMGSASAHKFYDLNGDGVQTAGEPDLSGWTMRLFSGSYCLGISVAEATTGAGADALFTARVAGVYSVLEAAQTNWINAASTPSCQDITIRRDAPGAVSFGNYQAEWGGLPTTYGSPGTVLYPLGAGTQLPQPVGEQQAVWLGAAVAPQPGPPVDGIDPAADGLVGHPSWGPGGLQLQVQVGSSGMVTGLHLAVWIDWDNDGAFQADELFEAPVAVGSNSLTVPAPANFAGDAQLEMRLRLYPSDPGIPSPTGLLSNGEVEDYILALSPLAVDLASFNLLARAAEVKISWETVAEAGVLGFNLSRAESEAGPWTRLNAALIPAVSPGSSGGASYAWADKTVKAPRAYFYRLDSMDLSGALETLAVGRVTFAGQVRAWAPMVQR